MVFENLAVKHRAFGDGVVVSKTDKYLTVKFGSVTKVFVYPDIFEKFLTLADGTVDPSIRADLEARASEQVQRQEKKAAENLRAMTHGIVIPGKEMTPETDEEENRYKSSETEEI